MMERMCESCIIHQILRGLPIDIRTCLQDSSYEKGIRFEREIQKLLESNGWFVFRCAESKPLDLIAVRDKRILFIECKSNYKEHGPELRRLAGIAAKLKRKVHLVHPYEGEFWDWIISGTERRIVDFEGVYR